MVCNKGDCHHEVQHQNLKEGNGNRMYQKKNFQLNIPRCQTTKSLKRVEELGWARRGTQKGRAKGGGVDENTSGLTRTSQDLRPESKPLGLEQMSSGWIGRCWSQSRVLFPNWDTVILQISEHSHALPANDRLLLRQTIRQESWE